MKLNMSYHSHLGFLSHISKNENDILKSRTRNRYPTLQRRNAMKEEDIEKILKKIESVSLNLKKNLK